MFNISDFKLGFAPELLLHPNTAYLIIGLTCFIIFVLAWVTIFTYMERNKRSLTQNEFLQLECIKKNPNLLNKIQKEASVKQEKIDRFELNMARLGLNITWDDKKEYKKKFLPIALMLTIFSIVSIPITTVILGIPFLGFLILGSILYYSYSKYFKYEVKAKRMEKELKLKGIIDVFNLVSVYMYKPKNYTIIDFLMGCISEPIVLGHDYRLLISDSMSYPLDEALDRFTARVKNPYVTKLVTFIKNEKNITSEQTSITLSVLVNELKEELEKNNNKITEGLIKSSIYSLLASFSVVVIIYFIPMVRYIQAMISSL